MVLILAGAAGAAEITWTLETVLSDTANRLEVITDGTLLTAVNEGSGTDSTVNGVTFQADAAGLGFPTNASGILDGSDAGIYNDLLDHLGYNYSATGGVITLSGLTVGQHYLVQLFLADNRSCCDGRIMIYGDNSGDTSNDHTAANALSQRYAITGVFIADSVSQDVMIEIQGAPGYGHLNAFQVRGIDENTFESLKNYWSMYADDIVDVADLSFFAQRWLMTGCDSPLWCGGADLDHLGGIVDWFDFAILA